MTKQQFLSELKAALSNVSEETREEILSDISEHFTAGITMGQTEGEICQKLGTPQSIAEQVREDSALQITTDTQKSEKKFGGYDINIKNSFTGVTAVDADLYMADIDLIPSDDDNFHVSIQGRCKGNKFTVENKDGTLYIRMEQQTFSFVFFGFLWNLKARISVPVNFQGNIKASSTAGNVSANSIRGDIELSSTSGNIKLLEHKGKRIKLETSAGNIKAELVNNYAETVKLISMAGNVKLSAQET